MGHIEDCCNFEEVLSWDLGHLGTTAVEHQVQQKKDLNYY